MLSYLIEGQPLERGWSAAPVIGPFHLDHVAVGVACVRWLIES